MEKRIIENIQYFQYEAEITFTNGSSIFFDWQPPFDVSEEEIIEWMTEQNIAPDSIEMHAHRFPDFFNLESLAENN